MMGRVFRPTREKVSPRLHSSYMRTPCKDAEEREPNANHARDSASLPLSPNRSTELHS